MATKDIRLCNHACSILFLRPTEQRALARRKCHFALRFDKQVVWPWAKVSKHDISVLSKEGFRVGLTPCIHSLWCPHSWKPPDVFIGILPPFPPLNPPWRVPPAMGGLISAPDPAVPDPTTDDAKEARVEGPDQTFEASPRRCSNTSRCLLHHPPDDPTAAFLI